MSYKPYYPGGWQSGENGDTPISPEALSHMDRGIGRAYTPQNLLDNSNFAFPVNQRGLALYSGATQYTLSRWRVPSKLSVNVEEGYIKLTCTSESARNGITQYIAEDRIPEPGTVVTLACMDRNGLIYCGSGAWPSSGSSRVFGKTTGFAGLLYPDRVGFVVSPGESVDLVWAALYLGEYPTATLPEYQPKAYLTEYLECLRYYWRPSTICGFGYTYSAATAYVSLVCPVEMRTTPTFTAAEDVVVTLRAGGNKYTGQFGVSPHLTDDNQLRLRLDITDLGIAANIPVSVTITGGAFEFSADL